MVILSVFSRFCCEKSWYIKHFVRFSFIFFRKKFEKFSHPPKILWGRSDFDRLYLKGKLPFLLEVTDEILACIQLRPSTTDPSSHKPDIRLFFKVWFSFCCWDFDRKSKFQKLKNKRISGLWLLRSVVEGRNWMPVFTRAILHTIERCPVIFASAQRWSSC